MDITKQVHLKANGPVEEMVNSVAYKQSFQKKIEAPSFYHLTTVITPSCTLLSVGRACNKGKNNTSSASDSDTIP